VTFSAGDGSHPVSQTVSGSGTHDLTPTWTYKQCPGTVRVSASAGGLSDTGSGSFACGE
jgi:hypothetical protein